MRVVTIKIPQLGNRCHLVHDGARALVVDPPRDLSAVEEAAAAREVEIVAVADTHVHNDYVSGGLALARRHGADYLLCADEPVTFDRVGVRDGDLVPVGDLEVEVIATPGHTLHHQAFLARHGRRQALFSGGSLLDGTVGRTDLVDPRLTQDLARAQWTSARALARLDADTRLHPTHGFGSFCAGTPASTPGSGNGPVTLAQQRSTNPVLLTEREPFVSELVAAIGPIPAHYARLAPLNLAGAGAVPPRPARRATSEQVQDAVLRGSWVIDLRDRTAYAEGHVPGTVSIQYSAQFATYVGWLVPWDDDIVLLTDTPGVLESAVRDLAAIGIEGVATHVLDEDPLTATYRVSDWEGFRAAADGHRVVVDVRQRDEWESGHLPGAHHVAVQDVDIAGRDLPPGEVWVHCRSGYRAGIAASILQRMGRSVVHVDDDWDHVGELSIPTTGLAA
jgi:hydroxyacylglutathione hydrolase